MTACLSAGVRNLNAWDCTLFLYEGRYARQLRDVLIFPDSVIAGTDASARLDGGRFHHHQSGAAYRAAAQVHQMPVRRESVDA